MLDALITDQRKSYELDGYQGRDLEAAMDVYKCLIADLGPLSLSDMTYETCVYTNTFELSKNEIWVDRTGKQKINPNELYRQLLADIIREVKSRVSGILSDSDDKLILRLIDKAALGKTTTSINLDEGIELKLLPNSRTAKFNPSLESLGFGCMLEERVNTAFSQFMLSDKAIKSNKFEDNTGLSK